MRRGTKPGLPSEKLSRGTFQKCRHAGAVEITSPDTLPQQPDWLTEDGKNAWLDLIGRVSTTGAATELDSDLFAHFCNLSGACTAAWRAGAVPPAAHLTELRRLSEMFRVAGASSRVEAKAGAAGNAFLRNARR